MIFYRVIYNESSLHEYLLSIKVFKTDLFNRPCAILKSDLIKVKDLSNYMKSISPGCYYRKL